MPTTPTRPSGRPDHVPVGPPYPDPGLEESRATGWRLVGRVAIVVMVLGITLMWIYAFWGQHDVPGRLPDRTFSDAATPICQTAHDRIEALPKAHETRTPTERAAAVDQGSDALDAMLRDLRARMPAEEAQRTIIGAWLDDYATYVRDRREYTALLRVDPNVRFAVTQSDRDKSQITNAVNHFAEVNYMVICKTPDDLA